MSQGIREPMEPERWRYVQDVLADAIECPVDERGTLLDARCAGDVSLRAELESLLAAHDREGLVDRLQPLLKWSTPPIPERVTDWSGRAVARYRVQHVIGSGGMAVVYKGVDDRLGRAVALKFLSPSLSTEPRAKSAFIAEARAAAALDHPNVCTVYEIDQTDDGQLFIAMPLYDGETLQARLARGRLTFDEAQPIALQIARGLEHAHRAGIVHRDIKPSNIVLVRDGTAKIVDFGIAQMHDASRDVSATLAGTVSYMSPEQARALPVDHRSDIWSLAVVLHEMLTGSRPFDGVDRRAVRDAILESTPRLIAATHPDVPARMDAFLQRALAKAPEARYPSMSAFSAELSALAAERDRGRTASATDDTAIVGTTERRRAVVLVTCVSDYLSLVEQMEPADAHRLIARLREVAVDVVREYGGLVNQAIGEEIVSLFGVPLAHEDDDLRAVRAALELHARASGIDRRLRIQSGLHVGVIVARRLQEGPRRYDIVGAPATLAGRLAGIADADGVWVTPQMQRLVGPYVHAEACAAVNVDPHAEPMTPFRILGESGMTTRLDLSSRMGLTPYVGRQSELETLQGHVGRVCRGAGSVVGVIGEAGAGKSRLLHEILATVGPDSSVAVLRARCRAYADGIPYGVFVQLLCAALDLRPPLGSAEVVAARIRALDAALEPYVPLLLHVLSMRSDVYPLPKHLRGEHLQAALLDALAMLVTVLGRRQPLVVLIEDWHWADTGSRAALGRVAELVETSPLLLIVTSRDEHDAVTTLPLHTAVIRLGRLDFPSSAAIAQSVLGVRHVSDALAHRLYDRAGGNPFFLEQVCAALIEQQTVTVRDGSARVSGDESALMLPHTVQGVIRARLDNLDAEALEIARVAAVIGWEFEYALLADVVPAHIDLRTAIAAVEAAGLIQQRSTGRTIRYRFTHALTQEVCYDSLVGHQRKALHGAIGRRLASSQSDATDERASILAHHFGRAEDWPSAVRFGRRAAERAIELSQFGDALTILDQVVEWARRLPGEQIDLLADVLLQQERVCETLGLRARQQQIIDALIRHLAREEGSARLAEVYLRQGDLSTLLKRFDAADRALATALRIGQERSDTGLLRSALRSLGLLRWHEGRHQEALEITHRVLALDRECDDNLAVALDLTNLGNILRAIGDHHAARVKLEEALGMPALWNDPKKLVYTQHNLANVHRAVGDFDRALECLFQSDELCRVHLLPIQRSFHLTSIAHIQLQLGRIDLALDTYRSAVDLSRRARHAEGLVQSLRMLGNALVGLTRYEEALPYLEEAAQLFGQLEDHVSEAEMRSATARILERRSPQAAVAAWNAVLALHRRRGDTKNELTAREGLARALRADGPDAAIPAFEAAHALAATIGDRSRQASIGNVLGILEWTRGRYVEALRHYESVLALIRATDEHEPRMNTDKHEPRINTDEHEPRMNTDKHGSTRMNTDTHGSTRMNTDTHGSSTDKRQTTRWADEAVTLNSIGACLTRLGRRDEARTVLSESLALSRQLGERQLEAHALTTLGHVFVDAHDATRAAECFERSLVIRREIGDRSGEGWMYLRLADLRQGLDDRAGARAAYDAAATAAIEAADKELEAECARASARHA